MNRIVFIILPILLALTGCFGTKVYRPDPLIPSNETAYVEIDGTQAKKGSIFTSRSSFLKISEYKGNCEWDYKGYIYSTGNKKSKVFPIRANVLTELSFVRQVNHGNTVMDHEFPGYLKPQAGVTYTFVPIDKNDMDVDVYKSRNNGSKKLANDFLKKPRCR